jgi:hypothetical protein
MAMAEAMARARTSTKRATLESLDTLRRLIVTERLHRVTRRAAILSLFGAAVMAPSANVRAQGLASMTVHKDPSCDCCLAWVKHVRAAGFTVSVIETDRMDAVKARLGIPNELASCHTAELGGYAIEGHVPVGAIVRLLAEKPAANGLAVPGMPRGSPGMDGAPDTYNVVLFGPDGIRTFARYRGSQEI